MTKSYMYLKCPFCGNRCITAEPGKSQCPVCDATFEMDDRLECIFVDTENLRLPAQGTICTSCGLIQAGEQQHCLYCGAEISLTVQ